MSKDNLIICIGSCLEKYNYVTCIMIQKYIINSGKSNKIISEEEITEVLDFLVLAGFLEIFSGGVSTICTYMRFLPPNLKKLMKG